MNILVCPDKFKGSLNAAAVCQAICAGAYAESPDAQIICHPLADGGEGMLDILAERLNIELIYTQVSDPLFRPIAASYGFDAVTHTAYIEMSSASGLQLLQAYERNCLETSTVGTGELILAAIDRGAKTIVLGVGGSASNDAGMGVAQALGFRFLGFRFLDKQGQALQPIGRNLPLVCTLDDSKALPALADLPIEVASDVQNPLCGKQGAAYVFARQKGANDESIELLDRGLDNIARRIQQMNGREIRDLPDAGAAGGLGGGCVGMLGATLGSGIEMVMQMTGFESELEAADLVITGEGRLDDQTLAGKVVAGVLRLAKPYDVPVAVLCGDSEITEREVLRQGFFYCDTLLLIFKQCFPAGQALLKFFDPGVA